MGDSIVVHLIISGRTDDLKCRVLVFIRIVHLTISDSGSHHMSLKCIYYCTTVDMAHND
jgi:hypothetical protein